MTVAGDDVPFQSTVSLSPSLYGAAMTGALRAADVFRRVRACLDRVQAELASYTARLATGSQRERIERVIAVFPDRMEAAYTSEAARLSMEASPAYAARWPRNR